MTIVPRGLSSPRCMRNMICSATADHFPVDLTRRCRAPQVSPQGESRVSPTSKGGTRCLPELVYPVLPFIPLSAPPSFPRAPVPLSPLHYLRVDPEVPFPTWHPLLHVDQALLSVDRPHFVDGRPLAYPEGPERPPLLQDVAAHSQGKCVHRHFSRLMQLPLEPLDRRPFDVLCRPCFPVQEFYLALFRVCPVLVEV